MTVNIDDMLHQISNARAALKRVHSAIVEARTEIDRCGPVMDRPFDNAYEEIATFDGRLCEMARWWEMKR